MGMGVCCFGVVGVLGFRPTVAAARAALLARGGSRGARGGRGRCLVARQVHHAPGRSRRVRIRVGFRPSRARGVVRPAPLLRVARGRSRPRRRAGSRATGHGGRPAGRVRGLRRLALAAAEEGAEDAAHRRSSSTGAGRGRRGRDRGERERSRRRVVDITRSREPPGAPCGCRRRVRSVVVSAEAPLGTDEVGGKKRCCGRANRATTSSHSRPRNATMQLRSGKRKIDAYQPTFDPNLDIATVVFSHVQCVATRLRLAQVSKLWRDASKLAAGYPRRFDFSDAEAKRPTWRLA